MAKILSQEEVDALLKGISGGQIETQGDDVHDPSEVVVYDLTNQDRIIRGRMPALEMTNERFARLFRTSLSSLLRKVISVSAISIDTLKFGEFMKTLPVPTSMHLFRMEPLRGNAIFIVESKVIFLLVDILCGGTGKESYRVEGREFTAIENNLIKKVVLAALSDLEKAWSALTDVKVVYQRSEINPQFSQIVPLTDVVIVINFEVELEYSSGIISLCIPYATLEPFREKLQSGGMISEQLEVDKVWSRRVHQSLLESEVDIIVELGRTKIQTKKVVSLRRGDVIVLDAYCGDPLNVSVEGITKYLSHPGTYKGNQAVQISQLIRKKEAQQYGTK
jgi:flagellar motor switch protein FliM